MTQTQASRIDMFQRVVRAPAISWPVYDSTPLYDRSSLDALQADIRTIAQRWFKHEEHNSVEQFVCSLPLAYFLFDAHDRYADSTHYKMDALFRVFVLKDIHG